MEDDLKEKRDCLAVGGNEYYLRQNKASLRTPPVTAFLIETRSLFLSKGNTCTLGEIASGDLPRGSWYLPGKLVQPKRNAMKLRCSASALRDPYDSFWISTRIEDAGDCDGSVCGRFTVDAQGEPEYPRPHHHLVVSGAMPEAGPRFYSIL